MKVLRFLCLLICVQTPLSAQFKPIAESTEFEEPDEGFTRVLQLKNGCTMFFHVTIKSGISVRLFDEKYKGKPARNIQPSFGKLKKARVDGIFEINGDATLLVSELEGKSPVLYRLIIDGATGKLKKEEKLAELEKLGFLRKRVTLTSIWGVPDFKVAKDPHSDNYAVFIYRASESASKRMEIIHYGADHNELNRAYFSMLNDKYKYLNFFDIAVLGSDKVVILASVNDEGRYVFASLRKGQYIFSIEELNIPVNREPVSGILKYNQVTKKMMALVYQKTTEKRSHKYYTSLTAVDLNSNKMDNVVKIQAATIDQKNKEIFGKKNDFEGIPQNLCINADGSCSVMLEEIEYIETRSSSGSVRLHSMLGNIGVIHFDQQGKELGSYLVPKRQYIPGSWLPLFYVALRGTAGQELFWADQYKSFGYISTPDKNYLLLNDVDENGKQLKKGKVTTIRAVTSCDLFGYPLEGNEVVPSRKMVFGEAGKKDGHDLGVILGADYMTSFNRYAALKLEIRGRRKKVKVVWLQPS